MSGGFKEYQGVFRVYFASETAQVELRSGRVLAHAQNMIAVSCGNPKLDRMARCIWVSVNQGLTLAHFSAQPKQFWSHLPCFTV